MTTGGMLGNDPYRGARWKVMDVFNDRLNDFNRGFFSATGGTVSDVTVGSDTYRVHTFTSSGTFEVTSDGGSGEVEYLVVAGGGSGGGATGGGGGAGGYRSSVQGELSGENTSAETPLSLTVGTYTVTVGGPSQDSTFDTITSTRGGSSDRGAGGSGAGARGRDAPEPSFTGGGAGTTGQGHNGGTSYNALTTPKRSGGGGGGAGEPGPDANRRDPGNGGDGIESSINGTATYYAGGGVGHNNDSTTRTGGLGGGGGTGQAGQANTGGGGGSPGSNPGGSGIVIVRYKIG